MCVGRVNRMPFAVDDDDCDLSLALGKRIACAEIGAELAHHVGEFGIVYPDLVRTTDGTAAFDQRSVSRLLLRRHLLVRDFGIAAKCWALGHSHFPSCELAAHPVTAAAFCRSACTRAVQHSTTDQAR